MQARAPRVRDELALDHAAIRVVHGQQLNPDLLREIGSRAF